MKIKALAIIAALVALPAAAQYYDVMNLDLGGGSQSMRIAGINAKGQMAGSGMTAKNEYHAFFASPSTGVIDIGDLGMRNSQAQAINASGQVAGSAWATTNGAFSWHAFYWSQATGIVDLGTLGGQSSHAYGISDAGTVIGYSDMPDGSERAFGWNPAVGMFAMEAPDGSTSRAVRINASGLSVGGAQTAPTVSQALVWNATGQAKDIGGIGGASASGAGWITDAGHVIGTSAWYNEAGYAYVAQRPFFYTEATGIIDIGTLGGTRAIPVSVNPQGRVIGLSLTAGDSYDDQHAFTWALGSGMTELTLGGRKSVAIDINATGQVAGWSQLASGATHGFTWTQAGGIVDIGTFGGSSSAAYGVTKTGQVVGRAALPNGNDRAFLFENGQLKDLNDFTPNKPAGLDLLAAMWAAQSGSMVVETSAGFALLSPSSAGAAPPVVAPISANDPVAVGTLLSVSANFTDAATDTHTATFAFGDGTSPQPAIVNETNGSGTASASHAYSAAGVYPVVVTVTDSGGLKANVTRSVVVYDPSAGFVTGSGSIQSPAGAYKPDISAAGLATFSFVSKYQKGANTPTGTTEFQFATTSLSFSSDTYDWLVVAGARAQFKGAGSLNGGGGHQFMLTAVDGKLLGGADLDRFRIKIWRYDENLKQDVTVYDNQLNSGSEGTTSEGTAISAGQIVIHAVKK